VVQGEDLELKTQHHKKKKRRLTVKARHQWLTPAILATWEAEIRRIMVQSQPRQIVPETLSQKYPTPKKGLSGVT
jgi:hypothetical protein